MNGCAVLAPITGTTTAGTLAAIISEAAMAMATKVPTGAQEEEADLEGAAARVAAPTATPEAQEEALSLIHI